MERACAAVAARAVGMQAVTIAALALAGTLAVLEDGWEVADVGYRIEAVGFAGRDEEPRACLGRPDSSLEACACKHSHLRLAVVLG